MTTKPIQMTVDELQHLLWFAQAEVRDATTYRITNEVQVSHDVTRYDGNLMTSFSGPFDDVIIDVTERTEVTITVMQSAADDDGEELPENVDFDTDWGWFNAETNRWTFVKEASRTVTFSPDVALINDDGTISSQDERSAFLIKKGRMHDWDNLHAFA